MVSPEGQMIESDAALYELGSVIFEPGVNLNWSCDVLWGIVRVLINSTALLNLIK